MSLQVSLHLDQPTGIQKAVQFFFVRRFRSALPVIAQEISKAIQPLVRNAFQESPEYNSILGGQLMKEFGLDYEDAHDAVYYIIEATINSIKVEILPETREVLGGLSIRILSEDFHELLSTPLAKYTSTSKNGTFIIEWLKWLLFQGDHIVISDFRIAYYRRPVPGSRSGLAIMREGGSWRVPPEFSGVADDNWILRTLRPIMPQIGEMIRERFRRI